MVDKPFLEFWGNFLINAAKGQKQLENMTAWINQDFEGFDDLKAMFNKFYGLEFLEKDTPDYVEAWKKASDDFQRSFTNFMRLMGVVSKDEHLTLVEKYEALKKKAAAQEETIHHLQMLLNDKKTGPQIDAAKGFQELMEKQNEQFLQAMKVFGKFFKPENGQS